MEAIFLADAHLTGRQDPNQRELVSFLISLASRKPAPGHVFLLGDIFEFWIGRNLVADYEYSPVVTALRRLQECGCTVSFIEGNHDFFLGASLGDDWGISVYHQSADLQLDGRRIYLAHGDMVKTSDLRYRILRFFLHNQIILSLVNNLPPGLVWKTAYRLARLSRKHNYPPEKNPLRPAFLDFSRQKIREGFNVVILAHSHQAEIVKLQEGGISGTYANPGDWLGGKSYLSWQDGSLELRRKTNDSTGDGADSVRFSI